MVLLAGHVVVMVSPHFGPLRWIPPQALWKKTLNPFSSFFPFCYSGWKPRVDNPSVSGHPDFSFPSAVVPKICSGCKESPSDSNEISHEYICRFVFPAEFVIAWPEKQVTHNIDFSPLFILALKTVFSIVWNSTSVGRMRRPRLLRDPFKLEVSHRPPPFFTNEPVFSANLPSSGCFPMRSFRTAL